jgi:HEAT repeat protein
VAALVGALKDGAPDVRQVAAQALGAVGRDAPDAVEALEESLKDETPWVRQQAAEALDRIRGG